VNFTIRTLGLSTTVTLAMLGSSHLQASDDRKGGLDAHEHGSARLLVVREQGELTIEFESPAYNLLGFEHVPTSNEQIAEKDRVLTILNDPQNIIGLPDDAGCNNTSMDVEWSAEEHDDHAGHKDDDDDHAGHKDDDHAGHKDHDDHAGEGETHSEFHLTYVYKCGDHVESITLKAFEHFPALEKVSAEFVHDEGQGGASLDPNSPTLDL